MKLVSLPLTWTNLKLGFLQLCGIRFCNVFNVALFESLIEFVHSLLTRFEEFEAEEKKLSESDHYAQVKWVGKQNRRYEKLGSAPELLQTPAD